MARIGDRHPDGAPGDWFVDTHCFDCDAARNVAPGLIVRNPGDGVSLFDLPVLPRAVEERNQRSRTWKLWVLWPRGAVQLLGTLDRPCEQKLGSHKHPHLCMVHTGWQ